MSTHSHTIADPTRLGEQPNHSARLVVYIEESGKLRSQIVSLPEDVYVTFGRSRGCTVTVDSERMSRNHLRIVRRGTEVLIEDLGSRNGTRLNGDLIEASTRLLPGQEATAGPISIVLTTTGALRWRRRLMEPSLFSERLRGEVDRGARYKRPFCLAMLALGGEQTEVDAAASRLCGSIRSMDAVSEYSDGEFLLMLPELTAKAGAEALERIGAVVAGDGELQVRASLASYPGDASQADALVDAASSGLRKARRQATRSVVRAQASAASASEAIAEAAPTKALFVMIKKVAASPMTVLIYGETGAGKEIAARAIHQNSNRSSGPLIVLNCACLPANLLESELFGHERGAFTGADSQKIGFFEAADGGTLFLDEIGEIESGLQAKLLRALESRKIVRVGGTAELAVDVRVVCATNRDLNEEVAQGRFRSDLFYRLGGFTISVPPLRERVADISPLATRFVTQVAFELDRQPPTFSKEALGAIEAYGWPGNVRELRNAVERATVLAADGVIQRSDLPAAVASTQLAAAADSPVVSANQLDAVERSAIAQALAEVGGNQTRAAKNLGLTRRALIYRMEKHGLKARPKG